MEITIDNLMDGLWGNTSASEKQNHEVIDIPLELIDPHPFHTFNVFDNEEMDELVEGILEFNGNFSPAIVRRKNERYELISGHRRKRACEIAGLETLKCIAVDVDDNESIIMMGKANLLSRERILPSERARTFHEMSNAYKRQGKRTDLTDEASFCTSRKIAEETNHSPSQVKRFIRLNRLNPYLLDAIKCQVFMYKKSYIKMYNYSDG